MSSIFEKILRYLPEYFLKKGDFLSSPGEVELRLLFQNLITNAIKFRKTNKQPIVEIIFKNQPKFWQFCIADNGMGIDKEKHQEIFKIFTKLRTVNKCEGQGLGLAFCKK